MFAYLAASHRFSPVKGVPVADTVVDAGGNPVVVLTMVVDGNVWNVCPGTVVVGRAVEVGAAVVVGGGAAVVGAGAAVTAGAPQYASAKGGGVAFGRIFETTQRKHHTSYRSSFRGLLHSRSSSHGKRLWLLRARQCAAIKVHILKTRFKHSKKNKNENNKPWRGEFTSKKAQRLGSLEFKLLGSRTVRGSILM